MQKTFEQLTDRGKEIKVGYTNTTFSFKGSDLVKKIKHA